MNSTEKVINGKKIRFNFIYSIYPLLLGIAAIITIQLGLMRTEEEKKAA